MYWQWIVMLSDSRRPLMKGSVVLAEVREWRHWRWSWLKWTEAAQLGSCLSSGFTLFAKLSDIGPTVSKGCWSQSHGAVSGDVRSKGFAGGIGSRLRS